MIALLSLLTEELRKVCKESYLEENTSEHVTYPYLTFSYTSEQLENKREGFYIDIDIFDNCGANALELERLSTQIRDHFHEKTFITCDLVAQSECRNRDVIPTTHEQIKRRWVQLYIRVDWRNQ